MDGFTQELLEAAYREVRKKQRKGELDAVNVRHHLWKRWADARDGTIARWAERIAAKLPCARLAAKVETVFDLLDEAGIYWWEWPHDEDEAVYAVAWGLATLRWVNREHAGRAPVPDCTDDEIEAWLEAREPRQLALWGLAA
jgi:hypothetical protein